ncbi:MAG: DUF4249 domain-containing protein [Bacteroides sp.]|nr:DUF4249 domain-containing protein [Bacteroides sp.]
MAILRKIYLLLLISALAMSLTSCYQDFEPDIESVPVLCMNSEITPGDSINLFLTRTWRWSEGNEYKIDVEVRDAEVRLIVNGNYEETLMPTTIHTGKGFDYPYQEERECYQSRYRPKSGDEIRIEASSPRYGEAFAEVKVPYTVPIDRVEPEIQSFIALGDTTGFPAVAERCEYILRFKLLTYFTDPADSVNYYDFSVGTSAHSNYDNEASAFLSSVNPIFSGDPIFTEHVSVLESAIAETSGYTIFSDRQINGRTYPLRIGFDDFSFYYFNPLDLEGPKEYGFKVSLRHIDSTYYKHVISLWEANDAIVGSLGGVGLAPPVYSYSNVSTGAGVVAAYAVSTYTLPIVDIISIAEQK